MSDLISRADAIDALCHNCAYYTDAQCKTDSGYWCESGAMIMEDIPSADAVEYESTVTLNSPISISAYGTSEYVKLEQEYEMLQSAYDEQSRVIDGLQAIIDNYKAESADAVHIETYRELYEKYVELKHASADADCSTCKHKDKDWDSEECDSCCGNNNHYASAEPQLDVYAQEYKAYRESLKKERGMTREEAIKVFSVTKEAIQKNGQEIFDRQDIPLIDMAIEALSAPQTDLISRADAIKALASIQKYNLDERNRLRIYAPWNKPKRIFVEIVAIYRTIYTLPSANRLSGEWVEIEDYNGDYHYQCSVCKDEFYIEYGTPEENGYAYCPACGAKMKGGDTE